MSPKRFTPLFFITLILTACTTDLQINTIDNTPKEETGNVSGSVEAGPFNPLDIDMQGMPGGVYTLRVNGETYTVTKP